MGAPRAKKRPGRPLSKRCARGHDMKVWRRRRRGSKETYCGLCRLERNRESYRLPQHVAEMRSLLRDGLALSLTGPAAAEWQRRVFSFFGDVRRRGAAAPAEV